jgi:hypothetical protein
LEIRVPLLAKRALGMQISTATFGVAQFHERAANGAAAAIQNPTADVRDPPNGRGELSPTFTRSLSVSRGKWSG